MTHTGPVLKRHVTLAFSDLAGGASVRRGLVASQLLDLFLA
jgi:hypothetical protein